MIRLYETSPNERYEGMDGWTLQREKAFACGESMDSYAWVLRLRGNYIDHDQFRILLCQRHPRLELIDLPCTDDDEERQLAMAAHRARARQ